MKKRYHTNRTKYHFSLNSTNLNRSLRTSLRSVSRNFSIKLASFSQEESKCATTPLSDLNREEDHMFKLADEISENELKAFAFGCITSLANLAQSEKQSINQALNEMVNKELTSFVNLAQESQEAQREFKEYLSWSKQFISGVQPLLTMANVPAEELGELNAQVIQCAERSMCKKHRSRTLGKRVSFLVESVADYVGSTGLEMGFPKPVMDKVARSISHVLTARTESFLLLKKHEE